MATTSPINGLPTPDDSSPNSPPIHFQALNNQLDTRLVPQFATTTARNNAITAPVNGMMCAVAGYPMIYRGGTWHGITAGAGWQRAADATLYTATHDVMTLSIADPGYPFALQTSGSVLLQQLGAGVTVHAEVRVGGVVVGPVGSDVINSSGSTIANALASTPGTGLSGPYTGPQTVTFALVKTAGAGGNGFQAYASSNFNMLAVLVIPT